MHYRDVPLTCGFVVLGLLRTRETACRRVMCDRQFDARGDRSRRRSGASCEHSDIGCSQQRCAAVDRHIPLGSGARRALFAASEGGVGVKMEIEELLARAWGAVEKAGIPEPLQEYAFKEALTRLSQSGQVAEQKRDETPRPEDKPDVDSADTSIDLTVDQLFKKFAHESSIDIADLERVFYFADGVPHLNGPRSKLGNNASSQARAIAAALTAAYDYALDLTPIADQLVRDEAERLKVDLGRNWSKRMDGAPGVSWIGPARQKQFKTKADAQDVLKKIVASALGKADE